MRCVLWGAIALLLGVDSSTLAQVLPFPTNEDPSNQIRFRDATGADHRRQHLVEFIWPDGLPQSMPTLTRDVALPDRLSDVNPQRIARADELAIEVSGFDYHMRAYLFLPVEATARPRPVIVHQGHSHDLDAGVGRLVDHLLKHGYPVVVMKMPLFGWNSDTTARLPAQGEISLESHAELIEKVGAPEDGLGFRFFLEPVVQAINYLDAEFADGGSVAMIGLSGGGWTTSMVAAIDPRIALSVPIAGSSPLYVRNRSIKDAGDPEQYFLPLYREDIDENGNGGGIATWLEIYALGGYGQGRRQIMVTNEFDSCCFAGTFAQEFEDALSNLVRDRLGAGSWSYVLDSTHRGHQISEHVVATVIDPALDITGSPPGPVEK